MTKEKIMTKKSRVCLIIFVAILIGISMFCGLSNIEASAFSGSNNTLNEQKLYDETNTYDVDPDCFEDDGRIKTEIISTREYPQYNILYKFNQKNNWQVMDHAQITVLTHGLKSNAGTWSNKFAATFKNDSFAFDKDSLISKMVEEVGVANVYWACMSDYNKFELYDITAQTGQYNKINPIEVVTDISKHIIIVFDAYKRPAEYGSDESNANIYYQFNYMLSKIIYDVKMANGGILPKVNLVGHSKGGLTNLQYALDHPDLVSTLVSLDTPYFGSTTARLFGEIVMGGSSDGLDDILDVNLYYGYNKRWNENYNALYKDIDVYAFGSYHTLMSLAEVITSDCSESIPVWGQLLIGLGLDALNVWKLHSISSYITERVILAIITEMLDIIFPNSKLVDAAEILFQEINYDVYPLFVSWYNDILVNLDSQLGNDTGSIKHPYSGSYLGFKRMVRPFQVFDDYVNYEKVAQASVPVGHNLVARDKLVVSKVVSVLDLGVNTNSAYVTIENDDNTVTFVRYNGEYSNSTFYVPETIKGKTVTEIGAYAFDGETNITEIVLPNTIKKISAYAFAGLENLTTISFTGIGQPQLEKIGYGAFSGCTHLNKFNSSNIETLNMPSNVKFVDCYAFYGTDFTTVSLGANINYIGDAAFSNISGLNNISVSGNSSYFSNNGALFNSEGWLMQYPIAKANASYTIPSSVSNVTIRHISKYAFLGANSLTTLNLNNIISIDAYAFIGCANLTTLTNTSDVEFVGAFAFEGTPIMNQAQDFITIGKVLCRYNGTDSVLDVSDFPTGITRIGANAFCNNETLTEIQLPLNIIDIDNGAFIDCPNLVKIVSTNGTLPDVGKFTFVGLNDSFKFYCRKSLIDNLSSSSNWYGQSDTLEAIATRVYFENLNIYETFYYGSFVTLPTEEIEGVYNKGWLRVDEDNNQTYGSYLTPSIWNETVATAAYRADLLLLKAYTLFIYNGETQIGAFNISTGDYYQLNKTDYIINGVTRSYANGAAMSNCYYNGYYGPSVVNGTTIAYFNGWTMLGNEISSGQWLKSYSNNSLYVYADWSVVEFTATVYNGYSSTYTKQFNYCEGLILANPVRSGYMFKGWRNNGTGAIVDMPLISAGDVSLTAQWAKIYTITYENLTFMGQTAKVYWNNYSSYAPTYYERGVGLDLTNVNALWIRKNTYGPCLVFLGWYTDMNFNTKVTSISTSATGNKTYYAKWRYDAGRLSRGGTYTITDVDPYTEEYRDNIHLGLKSNNLYQELKGIGIKYIYLEFKLQIREINDGYQEVLIYKDTSPTSNPIWSLTNIEHDPGGTNTTPAYYIWTCTFSIDDLKDCNFLYVRYGAHGFGADTWVTERLYVDRMYTATESSDEDVEEFTWDYSADVKDEDCISLNT